MSSSIDEQFVEFVVKSLVNNPDAVKVERRIDEKGVLLELTVDPEDLGRVIGKRGATAQSIRTLLRALGTKNDARYNLKIVDNGVYSGERRHNDDSESGLASANDLHSSSTGATDSDDDDLLTKPDAEDQSGSSDRLSRTRRELEELDDLDV